MHFVVINIWVYDNINILDFSARNASGYVPSYLVILFHANVGSAEGWTPNRWQAITWTSDDQYHDDVI